MPAIRGRRDRRACPDLVGSLERQGDPARPARKAQPAPQDPPVRWDHPGRQARTALLVLPAQSDPPDRPDPSARWGPRGQPDRKESPAAS